MADESENLVLTMLRQLNGKVDVMQADIAGIKRTLGGHTRTLDILLQDTRLIRAAVNDIARDNVTPGEVEAIHHDLNRLQRELAEVAARLDAIEAGN